MTVKTNLGLVEWAKGEHIILEKVENHWGAQPEIDRLIFKIQPDRARGPFSHRRRTEG